MIVTCDDLSPSILGGSQGVARFTIQGPPISFCPKVAWIESHQALERHPKVLKLKITMDLSLSETIGRLHRFWWWALDYALTGDLRPYSPEVIFAACDIPLPALCAVGLVDQEPHLRIHDWWDYAGRFIQLKYKNYPDTWLAIKSSYLGIPKGVPKGTPNNSPKNINLNRPKPTNLNQPTTKSKRVIFSIPTAQEVETYGLEINYKILGSKFVDHYEAKGWKIGQNPMKSWKAAVRTWKQREIEGGTYRAPDGSKGVSKWAAIARANREAEELRKRETAHEQISPRVGNLSPLTPEARADQ